MRLLRWSLFLATVVGVPVLFFWSPPVAFQAEVILEGHCVLSMSIPVVVILFSISDIGLSAGMLMIFLVPLLQHRKEMQSLDVGEAQATANQLKRVMKANIKYSSIAMISSCICLTAQGTLYWVSLSKEPLERDWLRIWGFFSISMDGTSLQAMYGSTLI